MAIVSKVDAAERLILSGIKMMERGDDPLAVHVVGASALNMLRELIMQAGDNYCSRVLQEGLFMSASTCRRGEPITLPTTPQIDALIDEVVEGIKAGEITQPSDLTIRLSAKELRKLLDYIYHPYNFLKHAQRDPLATLDESDVDPKGAIVHALSALSMLEPGRRLPEEVTPFLDKHGV